MSADRVLETVAREGVGAVLTIDWMLRAWRSCSLFSFLSTEEIHGSPFPAGLPSCPLPQPVPHSCLAPSFPCLSALLSCSISRDGARSAHPQKPFLTSPHPTRMNSRVLSSLLDGLSEALHLSPGACGGSLLPRAPACTQQGPARVKQTYTHCAPASRETQKEELGPMSRHPGALKGTTSKETPPRGMAVHCRR